MRSTVDEQDSSSGDEVPRFSPNPLVNLRRQFSRKTRRTSVDATPAEPRATFEIYRGGAYVPALLTPSLTPSRDGNDAEDEEDEVQSPMDEVRARPVFDEANWQRVLKQPSPSPSRRKLDLMLFDPPAGRPRSSSALEQPQQRPPMTPRHSHPSPVRLTESQPASPDERNEVIQRWLQSRTPIAPLRYSVSAVRPICAIEMGESVYGSVSATSSIHPPPSPVLDQSSTDFEGSSQTGETSADASTDAERDETPTPKRGAAVWWRGPDGTAQKNMLRPSYGHLRSISA